MPSKRDVTLLGAVALAALAARYRTPRGEVDVMAAEIANGYRIDSTKTPASLTAGERRRYALAPGKDYVDTPPLGENWQGVVKGGEAWPPGTEPEEPRSPWAVWATGRLLSADECAEWTRRAEALNLETGDFIFAGSSLFSSRFHTGARRHSSTRMVEDETFAATMDRRIRDLVPAALADGRAFGGVGKSFLVSRYEPGQFFAPHFDGRGSGGYNREQHTVSEFVVVLYLSDEFDGGATHYLAGQGSEVAQSVALKPPRGCAVVHRQGTVLHSGGEVLSGTKYIMQFFLYYAAPEQPEPRHMTNLRWGA